MISTRWSYLAAGLPLALLGVVLVSQSPSHALPQGNGGGNGGGPPSRDVLVINTPANPVPVTGAVSVSGQTTVSGSVQASQQGTWTVGIDPAHNQVEVASAPTFDHDEGFDVVNDGQTLEFGPFDMGAVRTLRILTRAVNGDVRYELVMPGPFGGIRIDEFNVAGESGNRYETRTYDAPPSSVIVRVTESGGPGGANYHFVLIGR
jgi:hypothetical protein